MEYKIPMRIVVVSPPAGVNFSLENNGNLVSVTRSTGEDITFDFHAIVKPQRNTGVPNFTGAFARGTPSKRFFYVNIGSWRVNRIVNGAEGRRFGFQRAIPNLSAKKR